MPQRINLYRLLPKRSMNRLRAKNLLRRICRRKKRRWYPCQRWKSSIGTLVSSVKWVCSTRMKLLSIVLRLVLSRRWYRSFTDVCRVQSTNVSLLRSCIGRRRSPGNGNWTLAIAPCCTLSTTRDLCYADIQPWFCVRAIGDEYLSETDFAFLFKIDMVPISRIPTGEHRCILSFAHRRRPLIRRGNCEWTPISAIKYSPKQIA